MNLSKQRGLIIGCHGGVGHAVLALLEHSGAGPRLREQLDTIFLVDRESPDNPVTLENGVLLPPTAIESAEDLAQLIREHHISEVIDLLSRKRLSTGLKRGDHRPDE